MEKAKTIGYISLVWGGFLVLTYLALAYTAIWRQEFLPVFPEGGQRPFPVENRTASGFRSVMEPASVVLSPQAFAILLTGLFLMVNGIFLLRYLERREKKETRKTIVSSLLTPDEKAAYEVLQKSDGQATQKQLSVQTGFSAVRTYRTIKRLEEKQIVKTFPFGMTKKVVLTEK